jgi:hypothetical protein
MRLNIVHQSNGKDCETNEKYRRLFGPLDLKMEEMSDIQPGNDVFLFNIIEHNTFHLTVHDWVTEPHTNLFYSTDLKTTTG